MRSGRSSARVSAVCSIRAAPSRSRITSRSTFSARLAAELDPRRAAEVVTAIATDTVVAVSVAMAANGEHVAMGRFVPYLDEVALTRCVTALGDEDLLRVAFVMERDERLTSVFETIGAERAERMLAAAHASGLDEEAEHVLERLDPIHPGACARPHGHEREGCQNPDPSRRAR